MVNVLFRISFSIFFEIVLVNPETSRYLSGKYFGEGPVQILCLIICIWLFIYLWVRNIGFSGTEVALQRVPSKRYSENIQQIYRRTPIPKCDFNNGCSHVNLLHIFRTLFPQNTYGGLLLQIRIFRIPSKGPACLVFYTFHGLLYQTIY